MNRREFITWAGVSALATSLPVALAACNPGEGEPTAETAAGPIPVGSVQELEAQGSLVIEEPEKIIVVRDPTDATQVLALTANCNHRNCTVEWQADDQTFVCPCHQSIFALDGTKQAGPATESLRSLTATIDGGQILVAT